MIWKVNELCHVLCTFSHNNMHIFKERPTSCQNKYFHHVLSSHVLMHTVIHWEFEADPNEHSWSKWRQGGPTYSETVFDGDSWGNWPQSAWDLIMSSCLSSPSCCIKLAIAWTHRCAYVYVSHSFKRNRSPMKILYQLFFVVPNLYDFLLQNIKEDFLKNGE